MIVQGQTTIFKQNLLSKLEDFTPTSTYVYKIALYNANANLDNTTLTYTTTNEVTGTGYTAGGQVLTPTIGADFQNNTAYVTFNNVTWSPANFTASGALIYNSTTNAAVAVLNFGNIKTATNTFTVTFPAGTSTSAVIRLGQSN
jgi:hypothetical protein